MSPDTGARRRQWRRAGIYVALILATAGLGSVLRFAPLGLPRLVVKYGGSTMWALVIYWAVAVCSPRWREMGVAVLAAMVAAAIEFFKLYRSPGVDAFRHTLLGVLVLGRIFSGWDIVAYWLAIWVGAVVDRRLVRPWVAAGEEQGLRSSALVE